MHFIKKRAESEANTGKKPEENMKKGPKKTAETKGSRAKKGKKFISILVAIFFAAALIVSSLKAVVLGVAAIYSLWQAMIEDGNWLGNFFNRIAGGKIKKKEQKKDKAEKSKEKNK